jgi:hypothetical protein
MSKSFKQKQTPVEGPAIDIVSLGCLLPYLLLKLAVSLFTNSVSCMMLCCDSHGVWRNWPGLAVKHTDLDSVPCNLCDQPGVWKIWLVAICGTVNAITHCACFVISTHL